jgi:transcriptional regulator with XRE-family HTH domain
MASIGRPTRQIPPTRPFASFANDLVALRVNAGLTVTQLAELANFSPAVISASAGGQHLPSSAALEAYVRGCGGDQPTVDAWLARRATERDRAVAQAASAVLSAGAGLAEMPADPPSVAASAEPIITIAGPDSAPPAGQLLAFPSPPRGAGSEPRDLRFNPYNPTTISTLTELAAALDNLRRGRSYREVAAAAARQGSREWSWIPVATMSGMLSGRSMPTIRSLETFLTGCGLSPQEWRPWVEAWERVGEHRARRSRSVQVVRIANTAPTDVGIRERPLDEIVRSDAGLLPDVPWYAPRQIDEELRLWLRTTGGARGGMLLLVGPSGAGKTRTLYEAVLAVLPHRGLCRPAGLAELNDFAAAPTPRTVVWLDNLADYEGLEPAMLRRLLGSRCIVLASLWPERYQQWTVLPLSGQPDPHASERGLLDLAAIMTLPVALSPIERGRITELASLDERFAAVLQTSDSAPFQTMLGGTDLVRRWITAPPSQQALITAAVDARRMGITGPLPAKLLHDAAVGYLSPVERAQLDSDWLTTALTYSTATVRGGVRALAPVATIVGTVIGYQVSDYLVHYAKLTRNVAAPPSEAWTAYTTHLLDSDDMLQAALAAQDRALLQHAEALLRAATLGRSGAARAALAELLRVQDRGEEAERVRWRGLNADGTTAAA